MSSIQQHVAKLKIDIDKYEIELLEVRRKIANAKSDLRYYEKLIKSGKTNVSVGEEPVKTGATAPDFDPATGLTYAQIERNIAQFEQAGDKTQADHWRAHLRGLRGA